MASLVPSPAGATPITATVTALGGSRTIAVLDAAVAITNLTGAGTLEGSFTTNVVELAAAGDDDYEVQAAVTDLTSVGLPDIGAENLALVPPPAAPAVGSVTQTLPAGTDTPGTGGAYDADGTAQRVWRNTGQSPSGFYNSTHTGTAKLRLTVPNGAEDGLYTGTLTVTLF
jgi:hypothetical protein